jgi:transcriptional regulator with XRE-family HTH domain
MRLRSVLAENVVRLRKEGGISQEALCHASGISRRYMSSVEQGDVSVGLDVIERIATVLEIEPYELLKPPSKKTKK